MRGIVVPKPTPIERFHSKIEVDPESGCWLWTAGINKWGYSKFKVDGRTRAGHRWSYEEFVGPIPEGLQIDHLCRVRRCVNPEHLEAVTCRENILRGETFQAENAAKTHCPKGHPYEDGNILWYKGTRSCRICKREQTARWRAENLEKRRRSDRELKQRQRDNAAVAAFIEAHPDVTDVSREAMIAWHLDLSRRRQGNWRSSSPPQI